MDTVRSRFQNHRSETYALIDRLTAREKEVIALLFAGKTIKSIARDLRVSYQTAAKHRTRVLAKLSLENEVELVHFLCLSIMTPGRDDPTIRPPDHGGESLIPANPTRPKNECTD